MGKMNGTCQENGFLKAQDDDYEKEDSAPARLVCSWRLMLAVLGSAGLLVVYTQRVGLSMAIVCMVNQTAVQMMAEPSNDSNVYLQSCSLVTFKSNTSTHQDGPFIWEKGIQGHILGAYFYGYLVSQVPAGMLAERYGSKRVLVSFITLSTVATLLSPIAAEVSYAFLIFLRIMVGIGSGAIFPAFHSFWSKWAPPAERSKLTGITYAGAMFGNVLVLPMSGLLCQHGFAGGWASIFYVIGGSSALWVLLWLLLVSDTPSSHWKIAGSEKRYIVRQLKGQTSAHIKKEKIPWLDVMRSPAVWAIIIANFTSDWGLYTLLTNIPTYMFEVLRFDIESNGFYSSLPYIALWINMLITPVVADKLQSAHLLNTTQTRKLCNSVGMFGAAIFLVGLAFLDCTKSMYAVGLLTLGVGISGSAYSGFLINHIDIAPKYAGTLLGLTNCIAATSGFIAPNVAAALTTHHTMAEWQRVFFIAAAVYVVGAVFYVIFASGNLQSWARESEALEEAELKAELKVNCDVDSKEMVPVANGVNCENPV